MTDDEALAAIVALANWSRIRLNDEIQHVRTRLERLRALETALEKVGSKGDSFEVLGRLIQAGER